MQRLSTVILSLVIAGILTVAVFGLSSGQSHVGNIFDMKTDAAQPVGFSAVFTAMLAAFWAYQGWAVIGYIGGEVKNANRNLPIGIAAGVFMVIIHLPAHQYHLSVIATNFKAGADSSISKWNRRR